MFSINEGYNVYRNWGAVLVGQWNEKVWFSQLSRYNQFTVLKWMKIWRFWRKPLVGAKYLTEGKSSK